MLRTRQWVYSLNHSLRLVDEHLSALIEPDNLAWIQAVGSLFPDALTTTFGFEYRLQSDSACVDFAINVANRGRSILAGSDPNLELADSLTALPSWQRIRDLCAQWEKPDSLLHQWIADLWLEFDADCTGQTNPEKSSLEKSIGTTVKPAIEGSVPGLFISLNDPAALGVPAQYDWIIHEILPILYSPISDRLRQNLTRCIHALLPQMGVFQVGFMFGRGIDAVRLCVAGSPAKLLDYLKQIDWSGSLEEVQNLLSLLEPSVDALILDLDIGEVIYPRIGIEGVYLSRYLPCVDGRWQALLEDLVAQGLCSVKKRDKLLRYSGYSQEKLVYQRLYVRGLNHVKLVYQAGKPLEAKIYFGVMHHATSAFNLSPLKQTQNHLTDLLANAANSQLLHPGSVPSVEAIATPSGASPLPPEPYQALAVSFLLRARNEAGWWADFRLAPGMSDEWVTGYVGTLLSNSSDPRVPEALAQAWTLLSRRSHRSTGTWGYNHLTPGDADSTGWGLQLAARVGAIASQRALQAMSALAAHVQPTGGISTYADEGPIRHFINAASEQSFQGWCGAQVCVSAAIAALPNYRRLMVDYLSHQQQPDGSWLSYWWHEPEYATALAAEAFHAALQNRAIAADKRTELEERLASAIQWGMERLQTGRISTSDHPQGSPFATAWCLRLLLLKADEPAVRAVIRQTAQWLIGQQYPDGSWISSARLRVPHPDQLHPEQVSHWVYHDTIQGSLVFDYNRIFTTATVLNVLQSVSLLEDV